MWGILLTLTAAKRLMMPFADGFWPPQPLRKPGLDKTTSPRFDTLIVRGGPAKGAG